MQFNIIPLVPRSDWQGLIQQFGNSWHHQHLPDVKTQGVQKACNCYAVASAMEFCLSVMRQSEQSLDAGAVFNELKEIDGGTYLGKVIEYGVMNGFRAMQSDFRWRIGQVYYCPTFDHQISAILYGFPIIRQINWYPTYIPDKTGWLNKYKVGVPEMHGIFGYKPILRNDGTGNIEYGIWHRNSRGKGWAPYTESCCAISERQSQDPGEGGAIAIASVTLI